MTSRRVYRIRSSAVYPQYATKVGGKTARQRHSTGWSCADALAEAHGSKHLVIDELAAVRAHTKICSCRSLPVMTIKATTGRS